MIMIPPRTATDDYLSKMALQLDIVFDVDLGELVRGRHVVARGILFGRPVRVPLIDPAEIRILMANAHDADNGGGFFTSRGSTSAPREYEDLLTEAELHYEFAPGLTDAEAEGTFDWLWTLSASDDVGTEYADNNSGTFNTRGGAASHGTRDLGGQIPPEARMLTLRFEPSDGWTPEKHWCRELVINLNDKCLAGTSCG
jgi:hypothetical protein